MAESSASPLYPQDRTQTAASSATARAALAVCAAFSLVACLFAAPAIAPQAHQAYAAPKALTVTFDDLTGVATWKASAGVTGYWFECEENPIVDSSTIGFCVSQSVTPDVSGNCSFDAKAFIEEMVSRGDIHRTHAYTLRAYASDGVEEEWMHVYSYTPVSNVFSELTNVKLDASSGKLSWDAFSGADTYWLGVEDQSQPLETTSVVLPEIIDSLFTYQGLAKKSSYAISVVARQGSVVLAMWSGTYSYTPKETTDPSEETIPALPVTFSASTGKATWKAYPGAASYCFGIDDGLVPLSGMTADFPTLIDGLYTSGVVAKKSSYVVSVTAMSSTHAPIATWSTTYAYTPKKADLALTLAPSLASLPVTFDKKTGKATWKAYSGAKSYWYGVDAVSFRLMAAAPTSRRSSTSAIPMAP